MDVVAKTTGTVGNFGPGFDAMSLALGPIGDTVRLRDATKDEIRVEGAAIPTSWNENAVGAVIDRLRDLTGKRTPLRVDLTKGVPPGSGLGSSASSSAAAALAFGAAFGPVAPEHLFEAAIAGEARVSGVHRDDVGAALFGGLALVDPDSYSVRAIPPPPSLRLAVVRPHVVLETRRMRAVLPKELPLEEAARNLSATARLVAAFHAGDVPAVGLALADRIAAPRRAPLVPGYAAAKAAAARAGGFGFALSGSGPAMFSVASGDAEAERIAAAMEAAVAAGGVPCSSFVGVPGEVRNLAARVR